MARTSRKNTSSPSSTTSATTKPVTTTATKVKRTRKSVPRDSPPQRSSIYRGVTRHRWTGRYEAHLWDKNCWNESQKKKGRQVYLGAYDDEETAAHAYDLAALKYWGQDTILNFPASNYEQEMKEMEGQTKEEYIGSLRRKSSGFSRGVSKYRGVARHHHNGRWEARIGRVFGNKYLYLGTYATQEEAATAYDMAAIDYRGLNAVTNFDLSRYIKSLRPNTQNNSPDQETLITDANPISPNPNHDLGLSSMSQQQSSNSCLKETIISVPPPRSSGGGGGSATSALGLLWQSSKFKEMLERTSENDDNSPSSSTPPESDHQPRSIFPDDIQTYFDCGDSSSYAEADDIIFGGLNSFASPMFHCDLDG